MPFNPFGGLSFYGRHLSKYFRGPYLTSANATPLSHIMIPLAPIHLDSKCQIPSCCPPSPCTCRPADLPTKKWMHPIADAVAITNRNYGQSTPTNRFSPSEDREHFISSVRNSNLGLCFFPSKCCVSHLSVDRFGKNFGGVMTLGQVKSSQNFCSFGPQRAEKLNI